MVAQPFHLVFNLRCDVQLPAIQSGLPVVAEAEVAGGLERASWNTCRLVGSWLGLAVFAALRRRRIPAELILAKGDGTAIAAEAEVKRGEFSGLIHAVQTLDSDSHTFARPGDEAALLAMVLHAIEGWEAAQAS